MPRLRVFLAEDELLIRAALEAELEEAGFDVLTAANGLAADDTLANEAAGLAAVVLDVNLGIGPNGYDIAWRVRARRPELPIVLLTADGAGPFVAADLGRAVHVAKPASDGAVVQSITRLLVGA